MVRKIKIERYCDKCKKKTNTYLKVSIVENHTHKTIKMKHTDICSKCAKKMFPELNKKNKRNAIPKFSESKNRDTRIIK